MDEIIKKLHNDYLYSYGEVWPVAWIHMAELDHDPGHQAQGELSPPSEGWGLSWPETGALPPAPAQYHKGILKQYF